MLIHDFNAIFEKWRDKLKELDPFIVLQSRKLLYSGMVSTLEDHLEKEFQTILKVGKRPLYKKKVNERWDQIQSKD